MKSTLLKQLLLSLYLFSATASDSDDESPQVPVPSGSDLASESLVVQNALRAVASAYDNGTTWSALYNPILHVALGDYGGHRVLPAERRIVDLALRGNVGDVIEAIQAHVLNIDALADRLVATMHPVLRTWDATTQNEVLFETYIISVPNAERGPVQVRLSDLISGAYAMSHIHQEINSLATTAADEPWAGQTLLQRRHRAIAGAITNYQSWSAMYVPFLLVATGQANAEDHQLMQEVLGVQLQPLLHQAQQHIANFQYPNILQGGAYHGQAGLVALLNNNRYWEWDVQNAALPVAMREALMYAYGQTGHFQRHTQQPAEMVDEIVARFNDARARNSRQARFVAEHSLPASPGQRRRTDPECIIALNIDDMRAPFPPPPSGRRTRSQARLEAESADVAEPSLSASPGQRRRTDHSTTSSPQSPGQQPVSVETSREIRALGFQLRTLRERFAREGWEGYTAPAATAAPRTPPQSPRRSTRVGAGCRMFSDAAYRSPPASGSGTLTTSRRTPPPAPRVPRHLDVRLGPTDPAHPFADRLEEFLSSGYAAQATSAPRSLPRQPSAPPSPRTPDGTASSACVTPPQSPRRSPRFPDASYRSPPASGTQPAGLWYRGTTSGSRQSMYRTPPRVPRHPSRPSSGAGTAAQTPDQFGTFLSPEAASPDRQFGVSYGHAAPPSAPRPLPRQAPAPPSPAILQSPEQNNLCAICQDSITNGAPIARVQPCGHLYHTDCIRDWLRIGGVWESTANPGEALFDAEVAQIPDGITSQSSPAELQQAGLVWVGARCPGCRGEVENRNRFV